MKMKRDGDHKASSSKDRNGDGKSSSGTHKASPDTRNKSSSDKAGQRDAGSGGQLGLIIGVCVAAFILILIIVVIIIVWKRKRDSQSKDLTKPTSITKGSDKHGHQIPKQQQGDLDGGKRAKSNPYSLEPQGHDAKPTGNGIVHAGLEPSAPHLPSPKVDAGNSLDKSNSSTVINMASPYHKARAEMEEMKYEYINPDKMEADMDQNPALPPRPDNLPQLSPKLSPEDSTQ